jgi:hypothetical protein
MSTNGNGPAQRLIVVSNRLPLTLRRVRRDGARSKPGGLPRRWADAARRHQGGSGEGLWIG